MAALSASGAASAARGDSGAPTYTPIKHVIVIIGENHTFDNVFATYQPPKGQHIKNLLSEGIITEEAAVSGPTGRRRHSSRPRTPRPTPSSPKITGAYKSLPRPNTTYVAHGL